MDMDDFPLTSALTEFGENHNGVDLADALPARAAGNGSALLRVSNAIVHVYKEMFGRGPTRAQAQFAGSDTLVVLLQDSMTVIERNLATMGEHVRVRESRLFLQYALEDELRAVVERTLGRKTIAFTSGIDTRCDLSVALFTLEPRHSAELESEDP